MAATTTTHSQELLHSQAQIFRDVFAHAASMSLKCAIQLGIPDLIHSHGRPLAHSDIVSQLSIPSSKSSGLGRLMRLLVHKGYFTSQTADDGGEVAYSLTPLSRLLLKDNPTNLSPWILGILDPYFMSVGHLLSQWHLHGQPGVTPMEMYHGKPFWDLTSEDSEFNSLFNEAMAGDSNVTMKVVVAECREAFRGLKSVVDVGGGNGTSARVIAEAFPEIRCTVYDLPHVVAAVPKSTAPAVDAVGGNMFEYIPPADAVFMKLILHDWNNEDCVKILKRCKEAIPSRADGGKIMIVEVVLDGDDQTTVTTEAQLYWDVAMLLTCEGKERSESEWKKIFMDAGFTGYKITPLGLRSMIEVFP